MGEFLAWLRESLLDINIALQIGLVAAAFIPALIFGPRLRQLVENHTRELIRTGLARRLLAAAIALATPLALLAVLAVERVVLGTIDRPIHLVDAAMSLMTAETFRRMAR